MWFEMDKDRLEAIVKFCNGRRVHVGDWGEDALFFGVDDKSDDESLVVSEVCMIYCGHGGKWVYEDGKWRRKWGRRSLGDTPPFLAED